VVSKNVKNFTAQNAVRKMFFEEKFFEINQKIFVRKMQTTRQQFAILKFEWAAINFQLLQTGLFNQCETTVFR
jgi:hypothetical protein